VLLFNGSIPLGGKYNLEGVSMEKQKGVRTTHPEYDEMLETWQRCDDATEGEKEIHSGTVKYLPKLAEEKDTDYQSRLKRTPYFNAVWRTISGLKGMLFRKAPVVEVPASIEPYLTDIDMAGTPLDVFAQDTCEEILTTGRIGILVDRPPMPENADGTPITVAQAEAYGLRPMFQKYDADSIINWKSERINNAVMLTLVVLKEEASVSTDQFSHVCEDRYRVLDLVNGVYRQRVFRINDRDEDEQVGGDIIPLMNNQPLSFIPFEFIGVDDVGDEPDTPPLLDLVNMNIHHYQVSADYEHGCHFSGLPTLFISGYNADNVQPGQPNKIYIGGPSANCLPDPAAKAYFVETSGNFQALRDNLNEKKAEMAVLGARMLEQQQKGVQSADTIKERSAGEQSQLAGMAQITGMAFTKCLEWMAMWSGADGDVKYEINKDFSTASITAQELTAYVGALQTGALSEAEFFTKMQELEVISSDITLEEHQANVQIKAPVLQGQTPVNA
jgi:hypothetical protein